MPITETQRIQRREFIGSSDAAALFGLVPTTPYDLWLEKTADLTPRRSTPAMDLGTALEPVALDLLCQWFEKQAPGRPLNMRRNQRRVHPSIPFMAANIDAVGTWDGLAFGAEAKTSGLCSPWLDAAWGDEQTDEMPPRVVVQACHAMACCPDLGRVFCPVILGHGEGFKVYRVDHNPELIEEIERRAVEFWTGFVVPRTRPPDGWAPPMVDTLKRVVRQPAAMKQTEIPADLFAAWESAREQRLAAEKVEDYEYRRLLAKLDDCECASILDADGNPTGKMVTYLETTVAESVRAGYTFRKLAVKNPPKPRRAVAK
jgi:predicted phage-related endonuclease